MNDWPIGISTGCFYQTSIFDCLPVIRESGFSLIEVCFSPAHLDYHDGEAVKRAATRIAELGMEAYSFHAPFAGHIDISSLHSEVREAALTEILQAAEAAAALCARFFVIHPGPEESGARPPDERFQRMENTVGILDRLAARCHELGLACAIEKKLPHLLFGNAPDVLWFLDAMKSCGTGACLDTGHALLSGELLIFARKLGPRLRMIHAHDNGGHHDDHLPPGEGVIDWTALLGELAAIHFDGAMILELAGAADPATTMANARWGRSHLRESSHRATIKQSFG